MSDKHGLLGIPEYTLADESASVFCPVYQYSGQNFPTHEVKLARGIEIHSEVATQEAFEAFCLLWTAVCLVLFWHIFDKSGPVFSAISSISESLRGIVLKVTLE